MHILPCLSKSALLFVLNLAKNTVYLNYIYFKISFKLLHFRVNPCLFLPRTKSFHFNSVPAAQQKWILCGNDLCTAADASLLERTVRFVLPCQIWLPPIKTVGSTIQQRKMLPIKLCFINAHTYHNPKLTLKVMHIQ